MNKTDQRDFSPPVSRWPRRLLITAIILLAVVGLLMVSVWQRRHSEELKLKETLALLDRADPGWRWDEIERARAVIPDASNSALQVLHAKSLLGSWGGARLDEALQDLDAQVVLSDTQSALLEAELAILVPALDEARKLADMPTGRYPAKRGPTPLDLLLDHVQEVRTVTGLLAYDALDKAQRKEMNAATGAIQAGLNASRSIGDEPTLIAQLIRIACRSIPIRRLERVLAQGEATESSLSELQLAIEKDESDPLYLHAIRGERAFQERNYQGLMTDPASLPGTYRAEFATVDPSSEKYKIGSVDLELVAKGLFAESLSGQFADLLRVMSDAVEISRRPLEEQRDALGLLETRVATESPLVRGQAPSFVKMHDACLRSHAEARCAAAAIAAERYRLANGRWPDSFDDLVKAKLLSKAPVDPYTKNLLLLRRESDGLIIYSVGADGNDNGGKLVRGQVLHSSPHDVGFRLWDVEHRRQPPKTVPSGGD